MAYNYTIYPEAINTLEKSGLKERIYKLIKDIDNCPSFHLGHFMESEESLYLTEELKEKDYFSYQFRKKL